MSFARRDALTVAELLRRAAQAEILPRFRNLAEGAVRQKTSELDLVTDADEAAERVIGAALLRAFPGALVKGLSEADLAFILDPVDGTLNFASGLPLFGVMAAVLRRGEVICGIILDPIADDWALAVGGEGAWIQRPNGPTQPLQVASPAPLSKLAGNVSWRYLSDDLRRVVTGNFWKFAMTPDFRCAAHTYRLNASGRLHFAF